MPALAEAVGWEGGMSRNVEEAHIYLADKDVDEVIRHREEKEGKVVDAIRANGKNPSLPSFSSFP